MSLALSRLLPSSLTVLTSRAAAFKEFWKAVPSVRQPNGSIADPQAQLVSARLTMNENWARGLLERGVTPNPWDLRQLALQVPTPKSRRLLQLFLGSVDVNATNYSWNRTLLHEVSNGTVAKQLLREGAIVDSLDELGRSPLSTAAEANHEEVVQTLLNANADTMSRDNKQKTPLHHAKSPEVVKMLLKAGADSNSRDNSKATPLHNANSPEAVKALLAAGAELEAVDSNGLTPLLRLSSGPAGDSTLSTLDELLQNRANVDARNRYGMTALFYHINGNRAYFSKDRVSLLLKYKADINARDEEGYTPLLWAVLYKNEDAIRLFLSLGADRTAKNNAGEGVLELAAKTASRGPWIFFPTEEITKMLEQES